MLRKPKQGDIYLAYLSTLKGSMQRGYRPVVIMQNDALNVTSSTFVIIPLTSTVKTGLSHYEINSNEHNGLAKTSYALCENITTISFSFLKEYCGHLNQDEFNGLLSTLQNVFISQIGGQENEVCQEQKRSV